MILRRAQRLAFIIIDDAPVRPLGNLLTPGYISNGDRGSDKRRGKD